MGSKAPTKPPKTNGCHAAVPVPPPPPPRCDRFTMVNRLAMVIKPGSKCFIGPKMEIEATVIEVAIKSSALYRVAWWSGNDRKTEWLEECELHFATEKMEVHLGFRG